MIKTSEFVKNSISILLGVAFPIGLATAFADDPSIILSHDRDRIIGELDRLDVDPFLEKPIVNASAVNGRPALGVQLVDGTLGIEVENVISGSAASAAGIIEGDQIVAIDEAKLDSADEVAKIVTRHPFNRTMRVTYRRNNENQFARIRFKDTTGTSPRDRRVIDASNRIEDVEDELDRLRREVRILRSAVQVLISEKRQSESIPNPVQPAIRSAD